MHLPDHLRAYILMTNEAMEKCRSDIISFEQEQKTYLDRMNELDCVARQCEQAFYGHSLAVPLRVEIGNLEGSILCLDEQIREQKGIMEGVTKVRNSLVASYLFRNDPNYIHLLAESTNLNTSLTSAKRLCEDFISMVDDAIANVVASQHSGLMYGQAFIAIADPRKVKRGIGIANTAIAYFNRDFDYGLVLRKDVRLLSVRVPDSGPSLDYLHEAKRQILLRRDMVKRFSDTITERIPGVFDAATAYINGLIDSVSSFEHPYR